MGEGSLLSNFFKGPKILVLGDIFPLIWGEKGFNEKKGGVSSKRIRLEKGLMWGLIGGNILNPE